MPIKELGKFTNSKVASHKILNDSHQGKIGIGKFGNNTHKTNIPFESSTPGASDATSDNDDK